MGIIVGCTQRARVPVFTAILSWSNIMVLVHVEMWCLSTNHDCHALRTPWRWRRRHSAPGSGRVNVHCCKQGTFFHAALSGKVVNVLPARFIFLTTISEFVAQSPARRKLDQLLFGQAELDFRRRSRPGKLTYDRKWQSCRCDFPCTLDKQWLS